MAKVTVSNVMPIGLYWGNIQGPDSGDPSLILSQTGSTFKFAIATDGDFAGWTVTATGTGFAYLSNGSVNEPTAGNITSIEFKDADGKAALTINGLAGADRPDLTEFYYYMFDTSSVVSRDLWSMFTYVLHGNDTINGSDRNDDLVAGKNGGNDIINGNGGNDYIKASAGDNIMNGGDGRDILSYNESFYEKDSYKGIVLNVATSTVQNCWGGTDTISNFERYVGSRFADTLTGSTAGREMFSGLRGADVIDGGGSGTDYAVYDEDALFGGIRGIVARLDLGTIRDGFGQTDQVSNIQRVIGTMAVDRFMGDASNNIFGGLGGIDKYDGGAGFDQVMFWPNDDHGAMHGVTVNLGKSSGQVIDDGFGNTETLVSIEGVQGTMFNDTIRLGGAGGLIMGFRGQDTLSGGAGKDTFEWDSTAEFGDTITNFKPGADTLDFEGVEGTDGIVRFENGTHSTLSGPAFYFNAADHKLYYDRDGSGADFAGLAVATLNNVNALSAGDFSII